MFLVAMVANAVSKQARQLTDIGRLECLVRKQREGVKFQSSHSFKKPPFYQAPKFEIMTGHIHCLNFRHLDPSGRLGPK